MSPNVFNIPANVSFIDMLAKELFEKHGGDVGELGRVTVLTTTRRAARALQTAFLRLSAGRPLILPRMQPIGDVDEDELLLEGDMSFSDIAEQILELPPAIEPMRRQLLLSKLILHKDGEGMDMAQAANLARELARLLDQVHTEGLDFTGLEELVPGEYAGHWQITLEFLKILTRHWPDILVADGVIDGAKRRDLLLRAQADYWQAHPPQGPVYAAGSTGSIPATAHLLKVVAGLPRGAVVLPGLDKYLDDDSWQAVAEDPSHHQYGLADLLNRLGVERRDVVDLLPTDVAASLPARLHLLSEALRPAKTTHKWNDAMPPEPGALENIERLDCASLHEEAGAIALMMRQTLETPGKTAVLITPDRDLSRQVSARMKRWGIEVDDSAGSSLEHTPPGVFLRLCAEMIADRFSPYALLGALKHPLARAGQSAHGFRQHVRRLELEALRGPRPAPGLDTIIAMLQQKAEKNPDLGELVRWAEGLRTLAAPVTDMPGPVVDFEAFFKRFIAFCEGLAATETQARALWGGASGEAAAEFVAEILQAADIPGDIDPANWPHLLDSLMTGRMVRQPYGQHPRLQIWGPIEGRLQRADLVILGGLNEGSWPPDAGSDPWMSRPMRQKFQLPSPEKRLGLSAHDFQQAFCASTVVLTRAQKVEGTPTVPSRWLLRIETFLNAFGQALPQTNSDAILQWQRRLDQPADYAPAPPPRPTPPVQARPRRLSVTRIERWLKDPYSIFASTILGLYPLADIAQDPGAADRGTLIHEALEKFVAAYPGDLPDAALEHLLAMGRDVFAELLSVPAVWAFWWPRFERIAHWFVEFERTRRQLYKTVAVEITGTIDIRMPAGSFTLSGTADRIDRDNSGRLAILDYKTGYPPSVTEVETGMAPQLALEAAMVGDGGFKGLEPAEIDVLAYVRLSGLEPAGELRSAAKEIEPEQLAENALEGLKRLVAAFDHEGMPYLSTPRPDLPLQFNDYEHLARVREWSGGGTE